MVRKRIKMKKLSVILISFLLFSCVNSQKIEISKEEYDKLKGKTPKILKVNGWEFKIITGSDGHEYTDNGGGNAYVCFHYIECEKCKEPTIKQ